LIGVAKLYPSYGLLVTKRSLNAIKLRRISPLLLKEGLGVVEKIYLLQRVNYHPPTPSLVRRGRIMLNLMALKRSLVTSKPINSSLSKKGEFH
jgi:hypothetical protein